VLEIQPNEKINKRLWEERVKLVAITA